MCWMTEISFFHTFFYVLIFFVMFFSCMFIPYIVYLIVLNVRFQMFRLETWDESKSQSQSQRGNSNYSAVPHTSTHSTLHTHFTLGQIHIFCLQFTLTFTVYIFDVSTFQTAFLNAQVFLQSMKDWSWSC